jgi:hypothetical protein
MPRRGRPQGPALRGEPFRSPCEPAGEARAGQPWPRPLRPGGRCATEGVLRSRTLSFPPVSWTPRSHGSAVGVWHGTQSETEVQSGVQGGGGRAVPDERQEHRRDCEGDGPHRDVRAGVDVGRGPSGALTTAASRPMRLTRCEVGHFVARALETDGDPRTSRLGRPGRGAEGKGFSPATLSAQPLQCRSWVPYAAPAA